MITTKERLSRVIYVANNRYNSKARRLGIANPFPSAVKLRELINRFPNLLISLEIVYLMGNDKDTTFYKKKRTSNWKSYPSTSPEAKAKYEKNRREKRRADAELREADNKRKAEIRKKGIDTLSDSYVKSTLVGKRKYFQNRSEIPDTLIPIQRKKLQLVRAWDALPEQIKNPSKPKKDKSQPKKRIWRPRTQEQIEARRNRRRGCSKEKAKKKEWQTKQRESLGDSYIKSLVQQSTGLSKTAITQEMINERRNKLKLKRYGKEEKSG